MRKMLFVLVAVAVVFAFTLPAMAGEKVEKKTELYGAIKLQTYIQDYDKENATATLRQFDDTDLNWNFNVGDSKFGFRAQSGDIGGVVELRPQTRADEGDHNIRYFYGSWNFGSGTLFIGQMHDPTWRGVCNPNFITGGFTGSYGDSGGTVRTPGVQVWFPIKAINGRLEFAALTPQVLRNLAFPGARDATGAAWAAAVGLPGYTENDTVMPQLQFAALMAAGPFSGALKGSYQTFDMVNNLDKSYSYDSWMLGFDATLTFGPFAVKGNLSYGENQKSTVSYYRTTLDFYPKYDAASDDLIPAEDWGLGLCASFQFTDKVSFEAGWARRQSTRDNPTFSGEDEGKAELLYFILPVQLTKGFMMYPQIGFSDEGEVKVNGVETDRGNRKLYAIIWEISF